MNIRAKISYAFSGALFCAAYCIIALPASYAEVIVCTILAFSGVIGLFLYLQGSFSKPPNSDEHKD